MKTQIGKNSQKETKKTTKQTGKKKGRLERIANPIDADSSHAKQRKRGRQKSQEIQDRRIATATIRDSRSKRVKMRVRQQERSQNTTRVMVTKT